MPVSFMNISEPARETPVIAECDLCVLGSSCTGLFAAIRAARLGLSVAIVERMGSLTGRSSPAGCAMCSLPAARSPASGLCRGAFA